MAEVEYSTTAKLPIGTIWDFVREMDHWAQWVVGYQSHEKQSETESTWVLKGDVGVLARTVRFQVTVTEWAGPERVGFALRGLNEPMQGSGAFVMEPVGAEQKGGETVIIHRCVVCQHIKRNRTVPDDNFDLIVELLVIGSHF